MGSRDEPTDRVMQCWTHWFRCASVATYLLKKKKKGGKSKQDIVMCKLSHARACMCACVHTRALNKKYWFHELWLSEDTILAQNNVIVRSNRVLTMKYESFTNMQPPCIFSNYRASSSAVYSRDSHALMTRHVIKWRWCRRGCRCICDLTAECGFTLGSC